MYNRDTELLFPPRVIPALQDLRGEPWEELVQHVLAQGPTALDLLAFVLLMVRLDGCATCQADSYRAMRGCTQCACQTIRRFRGSDEKLLELFHQARQDVQRCLQREP